MSMKDKVLVALSELMHKIASGEYIVTGYDKNNGYERDYVIGNVHPITMPTGSAQVAIRYHHRPPTEQDVALHNINQTMKDGGDWVSLVQEYFKNEDLEDLISEE